MAYKKAVKPLGLLLLAALTAYGLFRFLKDSPGSLCLVWRGKEATLLFAVAMAVVNVALDVVCWLWTYRLFGFRVLDATGVKVCLSAFASLMLPANIGDFIRPAIISRLGRGPVAEGVKAEVALLFFNGAGAAVLIAGVAAWRVYPPAAFAAVPAAVAVLVVALKFAAGLYQSAFDGMMSAPQKRVWVWHKIRSFFGRNLDLSSSPRIPMPAGVSGTYPSWAAIISLQALSWAASGFTLFFIARGLPGNISLSQAFLIAPICSVLGVSSGAPGGIGVSEGALSVSLSFAHIPAAHIALVVFAYRLITFWIWIPVGWIALAAVNRAGKSVNASPTA